MNKNIHTFIGCDGEYEESKIIIFGAPFDGTTSYRPGTRFASSHIRNESYGIETYSPYLDMDLMDFKIYDGGDLELPFGSPKKVLKIIEDYTEKVIKDNKIPFMIGGEHLVTLGTVKAIAKTYPKLNIIHFDAHADLRDEYLGEELSHATVMRRCWEILGDNRIFQFGIRSGDRKEFLWGKDHVYTNKFDFKGIEILEEKLKDVPVYLTIDLDVLDPSEFPATGTPEAGGVSFKELLSVIYKLSNLNIVGLDIVELSPPYDISGISTALACKLVRELLLQICR
ncbi:agmatinase [Schnuerera ultunensis]|nr:agmatinase [Schnuerera ultunensis]